MAELPYDSWASILTIAKSGRSGIGYGLSMEKRGTSTLGNDSREAITHDAEWLSH